MRVNIDWNQFVLVFIERNLEWVQNESHICFFKTIERDKFFLERITKNLFVCIEWGTHSNLECSCTNNSGSFKACVESCWLDHRGAPATVSHLGDLPTLLESNPRHSQVDDGYSCSLSAGVVVVTVLYHISRAGANNNNNTTDVATAMNVVEV